MKILLKSKKLIKYAEIDDCDVKKVLDFSPEWFVNRSKNFFQAVSVAKQDGTVVSLQRLVTNATYYQTIRFKDGNGLNCKKQNLIIQKHSKNETKDIDTRKIENSSHFMQREPGYVYKFNTDQLLVMANQLLEQF